MVLFISVDGNVDLHFDDTVDNIIAFIIQRTGPLIMFFAFTAFYFIINATVNAKHVSSVLFPSSSATVSLSFNRYHRRRVLVQRYFSHSSMLSTTLWATFSN